MHLTSRRLGWMAPVALAVGCAGPSAASLHPSLDPTAGVGPDYHGAVFDPGRPEGGPSYRYVRRVRRDSGEIVATHETHTPAGGFVVRQTAWHDADLDLRRFESIDGQAGTVSVLTRADDGTLTLSTGDGRRTRTRTEAERGPVVVGPTLFAFVRTHWAPLLRGEVVAVRFADVARRRTYPFRLRLFRHDAATVIIAFEATQTLVRWAVPTMWLTFEADGRQIRRYEGRVPPKILRRGRLRPFDARVEYAHAR